MSVLPSVSVVMPTHNRVAMLMRHLEALARQDWPLNELEVVVIADSCVDGTEAAVERYARQAPYHLRLLSHSAGSAAASRQAGARIAGGDLLLFIDDDIAAHPGMVRAHAEAYHPNGVTLGYSRPVMPTRPTRWQRDAYRWWEDRFREFASPGHRFTYRDFFSGNASMPAELFWRVGGFDLAFSGRLEDYELGLRLIKAGARFRFVADAVGDHHDTTSLTLWLRRVALDGAADVRMARAHPELRRILFTEAQHPSRLMRFIRAIAFAMPKRGAKVVRACLRLADLLEHAGLRYRWQALILTLRDFNYYRGVAGETGKVSVFLNWLGEAPPAPALDPSAPVVDLARLPDDEVLEALLAEGDVKGITVTYAGSVVLAIPPEIGAEPLRVEHLWAALRKTARYDFSPALALGLAQSPLGGA